MDTNLINFNTNENTLIDFNQGQNVLPNAQQDYEFDLQERAGIELSSDFQGVRNRLALEKAERETQDLMIYAEKALMSGEDTQKVVDTVKSYQPAVTVEDGDMALEIAAADRESAESLENNPQTASNAIVDSEAINDDMAKMQLYTGFVEALKGYVDNQPFTTKFAGFMEGIFDVQFLRNLGNKAVFPLEFTEGSSLTSESISQAINNYFGKKWTELSPKEFKSFLDNTYNFITTRNTDPIRLADMIEMLESGANPWEDRLAWAEAGTMALSGIKGAVKAASAVGDINKLNKLATEAVASGDTTTIAKEFVLPTAAKPFQTPVISSDARVAEQLELLTGDKAAREAVMTLKNAGIQDEASLKVIQAVERENVKKLFNNTSLDPVDVSIITDEMGFTKTISLLGDRSGRAMNKRTANKVAKELGLNDYQIVKRDGEGYFVQTVRDTDSSFKMIGSSADDERVAKAVEDWSYTGPKALEGVINHIIRNYFGNVGRPAKAQAKVVAADRIENALRVKFKKDYYSAFRALDKNDFKELEALHVEGHKGIGKWFTQEELDSMEIGEKAKTAYKAYKTMEDIAYLADNWSARKGFLKNGYKLFNGMYAKLEKISDYQDGSLRIIRDLDNNYITDIRKYSDDDYVLLKLHKRTVQSKNTDCTHVLVKRTELDERDLPEFVLPYVPGGRREYTRGTFFARMGTSYYNPGTGTMVNGFAKVLRASSDKSKIIKYCNEINEVADIVKRSKGMRKGMKEAFIDDELSKLDLEFFKVHTWEELKPLIKDADNPDGVIDINHKAKVLANGEKYIYDNNLATVADELNSEDVALEEMLDMLSNNKFMKSRGNLLEDINGESARIVDIDKMMNKAINKASATLAKDDVIKWFGDEFRKNFSRVIANRADVLAMSDRDMLTKAVVDSRLGMTQADRRHARAAENFLRHARRFLNAKTVWDERLENFMTEVAKGLDMFLPKGMKRGEVFEKVSKSDPAKAARALGFNYVFGWFNPLQFLNQAHGVSIVLSLEPVKGAIATTMYPLVRLARATAKTPEVQKKYITALKKLSGASEEELKGLFKVFDRYGTDNMAGMLVGIDKEYADALMRDRQLTRHWWDYQYIFANEGNAANYYIADITAWLARRDKGIEEVVRYSDSLALNMTQSSQSAFQSGQVLPTTLFAQWLTYPVRTLEALFKKEFTGLQKTSMLLTQFMLCGVEGMLGYNAYQSLVNWGVDKEVANDLSNGLIGELARSIGLNYNPGLDLKNQLKDVFAIYDTVKGEFRLPRIPAAKGGLQAAAMFKAVKELVAPETGEYDFFKYMKYLSTAPYLPTALKGLSSGITAWRFNKFYNSYGKIVNMDDIDVEQVIGRAIGFRPYEEKLNQYMFEANTEVDEVLQDEIDKIKPFIDDINFFKYETPDGDEHLNRLYDRYETILRGSIDELREFYGDESTVVNEYINRVSKLVQTPETYVTKDNITKTRMRLGDNFARIILRNMLGE